MVRARACRWHRMPVMVVPLGVDVKEETQRVKALKDMAEAVEVGATATASEATEVLVAMPDPEAC